jgi:hypothetical protein
MSRAWSGGGVVLRGGLLVVADGSGDEDDGLGGGMRPWSVGASGTSPRAGG